MNLALNCIVFSTLFAFLAAGDFHPDVIGGKEVTNPEDYPFIIRLISTDWILICGGSILKSNKIVTAAHCFADGIKVPLNSKDLRVVAGCLDPLTSKIWRNPSCQIRNVSKVISHPDFNVRTKVNDIALITLSSPLKIDRRTVNTISIHDSVLPPQATCTLIGWGWTDPVKGKDNRNLYKADVVIVSRKTCSNGTAYIITDNQVCTGGNDKAACNGDSGGPLTFEINGTHRLYGVVSYGTNCTVTMPDVYSRAEAYAHWLSEVPDGEALSTGDIVGIIISSVLFLVILIACVFIWRWLP